ncbi:HAD family hydrolase [Bacillus sp. AFS017336]|uniref:HAD family hydrolase n=1 Tax=Bacillus sp. AFS017336 TaxID=2033489 RepID=UPI000BF0372B|nr:HAD family hydrolase [Bacillus sp. AFS017336]PEL11398.1 haloacid dehalogenase [Bacillus sp. AFS017336]
MIKGIIFDLDDTLLWDQKSVEVAFANTCKLATEKYGINPLDFEKAVRESARNLYESYDTYEFTKLIGINPFEGLWGNFLEEHDQFPKMRANTSSYRKNAWTLALKSFGIEDQEFGQLLADTFPEERKGNPFVYDETFAVLNQLNEEYKLLLLTNGSPDLQHTKLSITPEIKEHFDQILISGDFGKGKPDPSIFEHALSLMELSKDEVIMVGDNLMTDILGSNRIGMKNVWINRHKKERNEVVPSYEITHLEELYPIIESLNE